MPINLNQLVNPGQKPLTPDQVWNSDEIMACNAMAEFSLSMDTLMEIVIAKIASIADY